VISARLQIAIDELNSNDKLLRKKRHLLESIRVANRKASEEALFQHQLHHMRDTQVRQKVADEITMNKELLP
jgi:hypothetical protein